MGKKQAKQPQALAHGTVVQLAGGRLAEWNSFAEEGTTYRTEHFRCIDTLGTMLRNGSITKEMHDAGQEFNRNFAHAQMNPAGAPPLDRIRGGGPWRDSMTERCAWARKRLGKALDAVGGINSPGGCAVWHVAGLGRSVKEWSALEGWNGRSLNQYEAKGILVGALAVLAVYYGLARDESHCQDNVRTL